MTINKQLKYTLASRDLIEGYQLERILPKNSPYFFWMYMLSVILFLALGIIDLSRVKPEDLDIISYLKSFFISDEIVTNNLASAIWNFLLALILSDYVIPKYNPISHWLFVRKYHKNFLQQEPKTLTINSDHIEIVSENHRKSMQWQDFSHFQENKQIFLLHGSLVKVIIPKRAFDNQELANMTSFFTSKIN